MKTSAKLTLLYFSLQLPGGFFLLLSHKHRLILWAILLNTVLTSSCFRRLEGKKQHSQILLELGSGGQLYLQIRYLYKIRKLARKEEAAFLWHGGGKQICLPRLAS